jgi:F-type H+-transporting ATPase subunit epsilon
VAKQLHVDLVSLEAKIWSGPAEMLVARTTDGELGVLPGHQPLLGQLVEPSQVRVKTPNQEELVFDVSSGFLSVTGEKTTVLAENCSLSTTRAAS